MSTKETQRAISNQTIDSMLTQQYVSFLKEINKEMDIAYEFEDRCEHIDYYRGARKALSTAAELFIKYYESTSSKNPIQ
jgi:hypothetical protein